MPELPEVETVRAGLARWVAGRTVADVEVRHPRAVRRHRAGCADLAARLRGARLVAASRRGKYLWLPLARGDEEGPVAGRVGADCQSRRRASGEERSRRQTALVVHLGMSGQLLVQDGRAPDQRHLHVRITFTEVERELRFVDQRTFGGLLLDPLVATADRPGEHVPAVLAHIARDPLDPHFDDALFVARLRRRDSALKRALLDQTLLSGVGNIYADESLWRAGLHGQRLARTLTRAQAAALLRHVRAVLQEALAAGGTSFDSLYVNVNGQGGYFERALAVYGRAGQACPRCGAAIRREAFMNRSSFFCPACQRAPRRVRRS